MLCPLPVMLLLAQSRASRRVLLGRLARMSRAWRTALPSSACKHCEQKLPVPTDIRCSVLECWTTFIKDSRFIFYPVDRVHVRFIVPGSDPNYLLDTHTCIRTDSMCCRIMDPRFVNSYFNYYVFTVLKAPK